MKLNKSEQLVLGYVRRDGYFTTDPGHTRRVNDAAHKLVSRGVCKIIRHGWTSDETRRQAAGGYTEVSTRPYSTIRVALSAC